MHACSGFRAHSIALASRVGVLALRAMDASIIFLIKKEIPRDAVGDFHSPCLKPMGPSPWPHGPSLSETQETLSIRGHIAVVVEYECKVRSL